jgi:hypothetical protein
MRSATRVVAKVVGVVAVLLCARVSQATPIAYDEAISGDLDANIPATLFTLDIGANTIKGTTSGHDISLPVVLPDFDDFAIAVPVGMHVTDITLAFQTTLEPGTTLAFVDYRLSAGNVASSRLPPFLAGGNIDFLGSSPVHPFDAALPLGPGTFLILENGIGTSFPGGAWTADYTWTFTVEAVPEPTSLCLLVSGLAGAWIQRRRRRPE